MRLLLLLLLPPSLASMSLTRTCTNLSEPTCFL
ncbi:hypothetical protein I307_05794 [Cryptococcus deuterogattii 99/473]|uniref:Uncharacterized protein n=1 Tax=Cryptococcus deuterogattii Ram5 TaxID=1296110 RepID=A0A0D0UUA0_9TREE|nr:hypothetical protein I309_05062 [Cryptococcus deuterogattii LA55]KIR31784.1 hypothetical protein I352_05779 [Cryptococcus deuterogattii MMRL2647]KIR37659.1 hypothetical protein I313_06383 [Cryptococcus deuterogattii Ram5]KIR70272.1 hypothetical protein I310_05899 [Cryptococcus deuterogattii CA1014]KIR89841.1 hypothetical protein I304_06360 [Cryptococcus deuterogattii CBS 10090]KIR96642.1 hypothetical protein L804_06127 [Cryptococcus deuterogattii 2001/935-1]KIY54813.1 hypothetical protein 